jgi:hypothetical protein
LLYRQLKRLCSQLSTSQIRITKQWRPCGSYYFEVDTSYLKKLNALTTEYGIASSVIEY